MHLALARIPRRAIWAGHSAAPEGRDMEQAYPRPGHREKISNCPSQTRSPKVLSHVRSIRLACVCGTFTEDSRRGRRNCTTQGMRRCGHWGSAATELAFLIKRWNRHEHMNTAGSVSSSNHGSRPISCSPRARFLQLLEPREASLVARASPKGRGCHLILLREAGDGRTA